MWGAPSPPDADVQGILLYRDMSLFFSDIVMHKITVMFALDGLSCRDSMRLRCHAHSPPGMIVCNTGAWGSTVGGGVGGREGARQTALVSWYCRTCSPCCCHGEPACVCSTHERGGAN
jgi:hypothetical protein